MYGALICGTPCGTSKHKVGGRQAAELLPLLHEHQKLRFRQQFPTRYGCYLHSHTPFLCPYGTANWDCELNTSSPIILSFSISCPTPPIILHIPRSNPALHFLSPFHPSGMSALRSSHFSAEEGMAQQGATLQNYNNELVKCIEDLREKREEVRRNGSQHCSTRS